MAHLKKANAMVVHPRVSGRGWDGVRNKAAKTKTVNLTDQAKEILNGSLNPDKFLFTHCTIVASVDTEKVPGVKLGKVKIGSSTIDRRYPDYYIKTACNQFVNNNGDSWSRDVLLASYASFIGGHNFQEHVQIEAKSKGRIIDAVARDIGDSVYIDILVATDRKHTQLIKDIESGKMATLSMGCTTDFTICSQCGHFAVDETELCEHVKYSKLNTFLDDEGQKRVVAELCGHKDYNENGGVKFIEASWVAVPAFQGAVMRNILKVGDLEHTDDEIRQILASPAPSWSAHAISKAANRVALDFGDEADVGGEVPPPPEEKKPEEKDAPFKDVEDELYETMKTRLKDRVKKDLEEKKLDESSAASNDSIIKEGRSLPRTHTQTLVVAATDKVAEHKRYAALAENLLRVASSDAALVDGLATLNSTFGVRVSADVYRAALKAGPLSLHSSPSDFVRSCSKTAGRELSPAELRVVVRVGTLLSRWASINNPSTIRSRSSS